ncbi:transporter [Ignatzschineria ureiclastica]|uniref:Transporter n=2 Tax=Ignatzschineria TaxID=112008 RepID=A0A2U2ADE5_9GAMM|nr:MULTISPECIES: SLC13 family permease [Ignatzschineria]PWD80676.1 transporter [Ignatzschineria ureiclastica]GGZ95391.1 transporter [Ignatzschineria ureiclastica]
MKDFTIIIFVLVYIAMAFGRIPWIKIDRTGAAVAGALAMIGIGALTPQVAWDSIDYSAVGLLFGLMVVSASFTVAGFYHKVAHKIATLPLSPNKLLAIFIVVGAGLASILTNDVVVVAMTPLLVSITLARGLNPIPFLLGFCFAANNGAAGSLIGSPKNMITAQTLDLSFSGILQVTGIPVLLSLGVTWAVVAFLYRNRWYLMTSKKGEAPEQTAGFVAFDRWETIKAGIVIVIVVACFLLTHIPREVVALAAASFLLLNRQIASSDMLKQVDGNLLLLIMGLFIVNAALSHTGAPQDILDYLLKAGINLNQPIVLFLVTAVMSIFVGTTPAIMLLIQYVHPEGNANALGAALILGACFTSNIFIFGSIAGITAVEQSATHNVKISFFDFTKPGGIISIICMAMAVIALWVNDLIVG